MTKSLWPHQEHALDELRKSLSSSTDRRAHIGLPPAAGRVVCQLPTGGGKTRLAAEIIRLTLAKHGGAIFCVPAIQLIDQTVDAFVAEGITNIGVLQGNHPLIRPYARVQVASVQTLPNRKMPLAKLVIIDECHRRFKFVSEWMQKEDWLRVPFIGLSATPWTRGLGKDYDDLIIGTTTRQLIDAGSLSKFRVYAPSHPDLSAVRTLANDYHEGDLADVMSKPVLISDAVMNYLDKGEQRPALCFAVDRAHGMKLKTSFERAGVAAEYADAFTSRADRNAIGQRLRSGETKVVCNVGIFTTGTDWPWVSCIILCRPTKSEMLYIQIVGRGLRTFAGKDDCLIFDHSDTALRLGLPTEIHHDELDDGKPRTGSDKRKKDDKKPMAKACPSCGVLKPARVHKCPACGFAPERQSNLDFHDGQLVEVVRGAEARSGPSPQERQRFYAMLVWQAMDREYSPKWVDHKYRAKWGAWPERHGINRDCSPLRPDDVMVGWLKSQQIAWAKSKAKERKAEDGRAGSTA